MSITIRYTQHECIGGVLIELITTIIFTGWVKIKTVVIVFLWKGARDPKWKNASFFFYFLIDLYSKLEAFIPNSFDPPQHIWLLRWNMRNISQLKKTWMIFVFSRDLLNLRRYECLQFNGNHSRFQYQHYQISQEEKYLKNIWPIALIKKSLSKLDGILVRI